MDKLVVDADTIAGEFSRITAEYFPVDGTSIINMEKYRNSLDEIMINLGPRDRRKQLFMDESKRITNFLNRFKL